VGKVGARIATGLVLLACIGTRAADVLEPQPEIEEVLVTGQQPGPGLWKVTRPADGTEHVLWILGSYGPLPKRMSWRSTELEAALAGSQAVIAPVSMRASVGALGGVTLLPSLIGVRRNPDGARLEDVVPPELYARWLPLKERYIGRDDDVEKWRPIFAAQELYEQALRKSGLEPSGVVWPAVEKRARKARLRILEPEVRVRFDQPRAAIREFKQAPLDDLECFAKTLERLESDLDLMRVRANAWASGDVAKLRTLAPVDNASACIAVALNAQVMRERGAGDWPVLRAAAWLEAVEAALAANASTVAVLSIDQILRPDGFVAQLRARGYVVEDP
jgi:uncharacterized protein YbaP (TraB family)